jgi:hypothetical protein
LAPAIVNDPISLSTYNQHYAARIEIATAPRSVSVLPVGLANSISLQMGQCDTGVRQARRSRFKSLRGLRVELSFDRLSDLRER